MQGPPSERATPLSIRLFGSCHVRLNGEPLPRLRSRKGEWLLALLVLRTGQSIGRDWLAENLWPDSLPDGALASLRQSLKDLRTALGTQGGRIQADTGRRLILDLAGAEVDVREFDLHVRAGDAESLRRAVALYGGPLLDGCHETWILAEREERERAYLNALDRLARDADSQGNPRAAIDYRRQAARAAPLTESVQRALMTALQHGGETQAAVEVYQELRRRMYREYGSEPDAETTALFRQIRATSQSGVRQDTPPSQARISHSKLPVPLTPLIGRQVELAEIESRLLTARLVTLTGTGGVGKTRLALAAAAAAAPQFADGAYFADLSNIQNEVLLLGVISAALGLEQDLGSVHHLTEVLTTRQLLLVFDNCEHLLTATARLASHLLQRCPHLRILATSREPLGLTGEVRTPVLPLSLPEYLAPGQEITATQIETIPAARLFSERGAAVCAGFKPTDAEAPLVLQLCRRLDGLPLALELAASLVDVLSLPEILQHLDDRFRLLSVGDPTKPRRQQTLQAVVDWSYERLDAEEQRLFRRAAAFTGSWSLAALETVCVDPQMSQSPVFPVLTRLVRKSLVVPEDTSIGGRRYRMLETLRQYAQQRLDESGEADRILRRHLQWLAMLVSQAEPEFHGPEQAATLARLAAEDENLNSLLEWALDPRRDLQDFYDGARLAVRLGRYWQIRGLYRQGRWHLLRALERIPHAETEDVASLRASLLGWAGFLALYEGNYREVVERTTAALEVWEVRRDDRGRAEALGTLAIAAKDRGDREVARSLFEESRQLWERVGDARGLAGTVGYLGILAVDAGNPDEAEALFERALALRRELQDIWGIAASLNNLGRLAASREDLEQARLLLEESLGLRRALEDRRSIAITLNSLGALALRQGDTQQAARLFYESLELVTAIGDRRSIAYSLEAAAQLAVEDDQLADGLRLLAAAARLRATLPAPLSNPEAAEQQLLMDSLRQRLGEREASRHLAAGDTFTLAQAVTLARSVLDRTTAANCD